MSDIPLFFYQDGTEYVELISRDASSNNINIFTNKQINLLGDCNIPAGNTYMIDNVPINSSTIEFLQVTLDSSTSWPSSDSETSILEISITSTGVWQINARLALTNTGNFIDLYSVSYGINSSLLTSGRYNSPMYPYQDLSFEMNETIEVLSIPYTVYFNILLSYSDSTDSGRIDENTTLFTAVKLGDLSNNDI